MRGGGGDGGWARLCRMSGGGGGAGVGQGRVAAHLRGVGEGVGAWVVQQKRQG